MIGKRIQLSRLNREELYRYLGYKECVPDDIINNIIDAYEEKILNNIKPSYVYNCFDIKEVYEESKYKGIEFAGTDLMLQGNSIKKHLRGCNKAVLMCATLSSEADKLIRRTEVKDMTEALVADALASVAIEQVCDFVEENIKEYCKGQFLTYRFGIGYGDLPLLHEKMILDILNAGKLIGLYCTESDILTPRKSVVCVIGLSDIPIPKGQRGCATCNMSKNCAYKKKGLSCNY